MMAGMITGEPNPEDVRKFYRALQRAQQDIEKLIIDTEKLEDKVRANGSH